MVQPPMTVCIPVFNEADVIGETIECLKRQTFQNFTVLISDNHSDDSSAQIIQDAIAEDPRFALHIQETNVGAHFNWRWLCENVKTKHTFFLGSHDLMSDNCLEECHKTLQSDKDLIGIIPVLKEDTQGGSILRPQIDTSKITDPVRRYLLAVLWDQFACHGLYETRAIRDAITATPSLQGSGAIYMARVAIAGRCAPCSTAWYLFRKRQAALPLAERKARYARNFQLKTTRFTGIRLAWEFFKLAFTTKLPGPKKVIRRILMFLSFPVVLVRYWYLIASDFRRKS